MEDSGNGQVDNDGNVEFGNNTAQEKKELDIFPQGSDGTFECKVREKLPPIPAIPVPSSTTEKKGGGTETYAGFDVQGDTRQFRAKNFHDRAELSGSVGL